MAYSSIQDLSPTKHAARAFAEGAAHGGGLRNVNEALAARVAGLGQ
jgi:hypothetical protein